MIYKLPAGHTITATVIDETGTIKQVQDGTIGAIFTTSQSYGAYLVDRDFIVSDNATVMIAPVTFNPANNADYVATASSVNVLESLLWYGAGVPVDYTDGTPPATGEGAAVKGALYIDITNGFVYRNSGSEAQPAWTKLGDAA
jgi:hypothetical protein